MENCRYIYHDESDADLTYRTSRQLFDTITYRELSRLIHYCRHAPFICTSSERGIEPVCTGSRMYLNALYFPHLPGMFVIEAQFVNNNMPADLVLLTTAEDARRDALELWGIPENDPGINKLVDHLESYDYSNTLKVTYEILENEWVKIAVLDGETVLGEKKRPLRWCPCHHGKREGVNDFHGVDEGVIATHALTYGHFNQDDIPGMWDFRKDRLNLNIPKLGCHCHC